MRHAAARGVELLSRAALDLHSRIIWLGVFRNFTCIDIRKDIRGEIIWHLMYQWSEWLVFVSALDQNANAPSMKDSAAFGANNDVQFCFVRREIAKRAPRTIPAFGEFCLS